MALFWCNMDLDKLGSEFIELVKLVDRLRSPGGCPWDAKQTVGTIKTYLLEEAYEVAEAVEKEDPREICQELGDLLFQILFMARIASEKGEYDVLEVVERISAKMIRRHPHVFGQEEAASADEVALNWAAIKKQERREAETGGSILDSVPANLPSLLRTHRIIERASKAGLGPGGASAVLESVRGGLASAEEAVASEDVENLGGVLGELFFDLACLARIEGMNAENLLRLANRRFQEDFERLEGHFQRRGLELEAASQEEKEKAWLSIRRERT